MHLLPQIRFVVDGLLPQGTSYLSRSCQDWEIVVAPPAFSAGSAGKNHSGILQTEKGTVLSLCLEDSLNRIQQRLMDSNRRCTGQSSLRNAVKNPYRMGCANRLREFITEHPDTNLVIIDTLQKVH